MQYKKSLGQHILKNQGVLKKIADALEDIGGKIVVEIGGGTGNLTRLLANNLPSKLIVYEIDENLVNLLREKFCQRQSALSPRKSAIVEIKNEDFLSADLKKFKNNYFLIGNIPYFITGKILRKIFNSDNYPKIAVLTISKEQGEKLIGLPHSNFWSNWIKIWGKIEKICVIKPGSFFPAPQIDSMAIKIEFYKKPLVENPENFAKFLKILFRRPKQTIKNNVKKIYNENKLSQINTLLNLRPHQLKFEEILELYQSNH